MNLICAYSSQDESGSENSVEPPPNKAPVEEKKPQIGTNSKPIEPKQILDCKPTPKANATQSSNIQTLLGKRKRNQLFSRRDLNSSDEDDSGDKDDLMA